MSRKPKIQWGLPVAPPNLGKGEDTLTVAEARELLAAQRYRRGAGKHCPCCGQPLKTYVRRLTDAVARAIIKLYRISNDEPLRADFGLREFTKAGEKASTDASYAALWGIIERHDRNRYRLTDVGRRWVDGRLRLPDAAAVTNMVVERWSLREVTAREALKEPLDFDELMGGISA